MVEKNKFEVSLNGIPYTLITELSLKETNEIIDYIEDHYKKYNHSAQSLTNISAIQLTALNIAQQLFESRKEFDIHKEETKEAVEKYPILIKENDEQEIKLSQWDKRAHEIREQMKSIELKYRDSIKEYQDKINSRDKQIRELNGKITENEQKIKSLNENHSRLESKYMENQQLLNRKSKELEELKGKVR